MFYWQKTLHLSYISLPSLGKRQPALGFTVVSGPDAEEAREGQVR